MCGLCLVFLFLFGHLAVGDLDSYILSTHPSQIASRSGMELKSLLIPKWEAQQGRPYDRRQLIYERRLLQRLAKGKVSMLEAYSLINKSRDQLAQKRRWLGEVVKMDLPRSESIPSPQPSSSSTPIDNLIIEAKIEATHEASPVA